MPSQHPLLWAIIVSGLAATAAMPVLKRLAAALKMTAARAGDAIPGRVPTLGGPGIIGAFVLGAGTAGMLPLWLVVGLVFLCIVGVVDDAIVLTPAQKIAAELIATLSMLLLGPGFVITGLRWLDLTIAGFWLVGIANAFNLIDGLDGLAAGVGAIIASGLSIAAALHGQVPVAVQTAALATALAGFLVFNFSPASIFMGDSGALPVGMLLGVLALRTAELATSSHIARAIFPIVIMMVPVLDTAVVIVSRIVTGHAISRRSLDHAHDRLLMLGLSTRSTAISCWGAQLAFALCALMMSLLPRTYVIMLMPLAGILSAVGALFMADLTFDAVTPASTYKEIHGLGRWILRLTYHWRIADRILDVATISAAYFGSYLIRFDFTVSEYQFAYVAANLWQVLILSYVAFVACGVYRNMWRFVSLSEALLFGKAAGLAGLLVAVLQYLEHGRISGSILSLFTLLLVNLLIVTRFSFHLLRRALKRLASKSYRVLIVGADRAGVAATWHLGPGGTTAREEVVGFLDDDPFKQGKLIHGSRVLGSLDAIESIYLRVQFNKIIIAASSISEARLNHLKSFARRNGIAFTYFDLGSNMDREPAVPTRVVGTEIAPAPVRANG